MTTRYYGSGVSVPLFDIADLTNRTTLGEAVTQAVLTDDDIPQAILNYKESQKQQLDLSGFHQYGKGTFGLPRMIMDHTPIGNGYTGFEGKDLENYYELYPIVPLRTNEQFLVRSESNEEYVQSKEILEYLNLDVDGLMDSIAENPDIGDINDAMVGLNISLLTEDPTGKAYLFEFFSKLRAHAHYDYGDWEPKIVEECHTEGEDQHLVCTEVDLNAQKHLNWVNFLAGEFKVSLGFHYINFGRFPQEGTYGDITVEIVLKDPVKWENIQHVGSGSTVDLSEYYDASEFIITKQISSSTVERVTIGGLQHRTYIHRKDRIEPVTLKELLNNPDVKDNFFVPIDSRTMEYLFGEIEGVELGLQTLSLNINALIKVKLKWYETGLFRAILTVVAVVLSVFTLGVTGLILAAFGSIIIPLAVDVFGLDPNTILVLNLIYNVLTLGSNLASTIQAGIQITAETLLQMTSAVSSQLVSILSDATELYFNYELEGLAEESKEFAAYLESAQEELDEATALLNEKPPFNYLGNPYFNPNETPEEFIYRTVGSPNKGTIVLQQAETFVSNALRLPEFTGTIDQHLYT